MNVEEIRSGFKKFLADDEKYRKFIRHLNRGQKQRLLFWQEAPVTDFFRSSKLPVPSYEELVDIFRICEIHEKELLKGTVPVANGHIDMTYTPEYRCAVMELFPNSYLRRINGPKEYYGKDMEIYFCQECRNAEIEYSSKNA